MKKIYFIIFLLAFAAQFSLATVPLPIASSTFSDTVKVAASNSDLNVYTKKMNPPYDTLWDVINSNSTTCYNTIIKMATKSITTISSNEQSAYKNALEGFWGLQTNMYQIPLSRADKLILETYNMWYTWIINQSIATSTPGEPSYYTYLAQEAQNNSSATSGIDSTVQQQKDTLQASVDKLTADQQAATQALETSRQEAFGAFVQSDLSLRGRLGTITNNSSISYQLVDSTGRVLDTILSGQTSSRVYVLSDYANDQQATMFTLVPYNGVGQITSGSAAWELSGGTIVILGNSVGLNTPGNPYGYADSITITRIYPEDEARAHVVDLKSLVTANQYWQVDFTINPLISVDLGDGTTAQVIYPFISKIETSTQGTSTSWDVTKDFPTAAEAIMDTTITITRSNSSENSYPAFDSADANSYWSDLAS